VFQEISAMIHSGKSFSLIIKGGYMKRIFLSAFIVLLLVASISASPTIRGNRGVLRVYSGDPELYSVRRPTMFLGFYQGFAQSDSLRELHYGLSFTLLFLQRFEFAYMIENLNSDFTPGDDPMSNEFKLKIVAVKSPFLKVSPIGVVGFPIGGSGGDPLYGGHLAATFDLGAARKILPFRIHANAGYLTSGGEGTIPLAAALEYPTKYVDFFVEGGISDAENTDLMVFTPGIKVKLWGVRVSGGYDFITEGEPANRFNFMFSWLGPFSGAEVTPEIGIGTIKGYVYDTKTDEPIKASAFLEGDINRSANSGGDGNFTIDELPPGEYTIVVRADEYSTFSEETEVARGETRKLRIGLEPVPHIGIFSGTVVDEATDLPLEANLTVLPVEEVMSSDPENGEFSLELEEGSYEVTVAKEGYYTIQDTFSIASKETTERRYALKKVEMAGIFKGKVIDDETEEPLFAAIKVNGLSTSSEAETGTFEASLSEGSYAVSVSKDGYIPQSDDISIMADSVTERLYRLAKVPVEEVTVSFRDILFDFDRFFIRKEFLPELDSLADYLNQSSKQVTLSGHACIIGNEAYNMELSRKRVQSVRESLLERGISDKVLKVEFFGETRPKYESSTEEGRKKNRRVEINLR
jgi:outer membrane protein OmpA-like peptidoglycan-associated protein